jgi:hypothetical protein
MSRPVGTTLIAVAVLGFSGWILHRAVLHPPGHHAHALLITAGILALLGLIAAHALWSLRPHAFMTFMLWGLGAMVALALVRLGAHARPHGAGIIPPLVYLGLILAGAALYLRRTA